MKWAALKGSIWIKTLLCLYNSLLYDPRSLLLVLGAFSPTFHSLALMDRRSPHQAFFLFGLPGAGKRCCHPCEGRRWALASPSCLFPSQRRMATSRRKVTARTPTTQSLFSLDRYNAAFIFPQDFYFSKHFPMCGLILCYIKLTT